MFKNLRAEMVREDLTNDDIASVLKIAPRTVQKKLNGEIGITISEAKVIKGLFKKEHTIDYLFQEDNQLAEAINN